MSSVVDLPQPSTDAVLASLVRRQPEGMGAKAGDFIVLCVDPERDAWRIYPIGHVDDQGFAVTVRDEHGALLAIERISERAARVVAPAQAFAPELAELCWRDFSGMGSVRAAMRPLSLVVREREATDGAAPSNLTCLPGGG